MKANPEEANRETRSLPMEWRYSSRRHPFAASDPLAGASETRAGGRFGDSFFVQLCDVNHASYEESYQKAFASARLESFQSTQEVRLVIAIRVTLLKPQSKL